jgi:hypothetical protein
MRERRFDGASPNRSSGIEAPLHFGLQYGALRAYPLAMSTSALARRSSVPLALYMVGCASQAPRLPILFGAPS